MNELSSGRHMLFFGYGEVADALMSRLSGEEYADNPWQFTFAVRRPRDLKEEIGDVNCVRFSSEEPLDDPEAVISPATHIVVSIPPGPKSDFVLLQHKQDILKWGSNLVWIGYLSTVGVYGDRGGDWVTEETMPRPKTDRAIRRLRAENDWIQLSDKMGVAAHAFRLGGLYSSSRNPLIGVKSKQAKRIISENQYFSRIHIDDAAQVVEASIRHPRAGGIYNVCDDLPSSQEEPVTFAAELLGVEPPRRLKLNLVNLSSVARSYYEESRRVRNDLIKQELGVELRFPTYREGLEAIHREMQAGSEK